MKLSEYAIQKIVPIIKGDNSLSPRTGPKLIDLFNSYGFRDVYDEKGLPADATNKSGLRMSRKQYVKNRVKQLSGSNKLRALLEQIINEAENKNQVVKELNEIILPEGYTINELFGKFSIIGGVIDNTKPVINQAHFEEIQDNILKVLDEAKVSIWVAMSWFTNDLILKKLVKKKEEGIDVKIAIYDDGINRKHGVDLSQLDYTPIKKSEKGGIMHNKFCVIDNQVVITGSYNWTNNAEFKNDENITILKDPDRATEYSTEFKRIII